MGLSGSSSAENCGIGKVKLRCDGKARKQSTSAGNGGPSRVVSFYEELNKYLDLEFLVEDIEESEVFSEFGESLKRGKSHDASLVSVLKENAREEIRPELMRSGTYNIGSQAFVCECGSSSSESYNHKLRNFLSPELCIRLPDGEHKKLFQKSIVAGNRVLLGRDDLIDTAMRYICDTEKDTCLPLFPSSLYTSNITCNSWYSLTGFLENGLSFEVPEGVEAISLMGYNFSVEDSDVRKSANLHSLSLLENLRLILRVKKTAKFTIIKPQIWFKRTEESLSQLEEENLTKRTLVSTVKNFHDEQQDRFYSQGIIYCSILSGTVSLVEGKEGVEVWWSFEGSVSSLPNEAIKLPLVASLDVGISKLESWLLNETVQHPESWIPFFVPQKKLRDSTPVWVHKLEKLLINAQILWKCQYLIKSLNTYNSCLLALAGTNLIEQDYRIGASSVLSNFLNEGHITIYTVCFSELINQFESWRVNHRITSDYCMEMMSLVCVGSLLTSESLLKTMLGLKEFGFEIKLAISSQEEFPLIGSKIPKDVLKERFVSILSKILLLRGLSLRSLLNYSTRDFLIQHLKTKIQTLQINGTEKVNLKESFNQVLSIFEKDQVFENAIQTFITGLYLINHLVLERTQFLVIRETIMSSMLFFAEVDRNITFARMIGEKLLGDRLNVAGGEVLEQISWKEISGVDVLFNLDKISGPTEALSCQIEEEATPLFETFNERMVKENNLLLNQRLGRVFESIQIQVHVLKVRLSPAFINFLLPRAVDEVKEELYSLRKGAFSRFQDDKENIGRVIFENCCQSKGFTDSNNSYLQEIETFMPGMDVNQKRISGKDQEAQQMISSFESEDDSSKSELKRISIPSMILSAAKSIISQKKSIGFTGIQCCNTDRTDFRNLLDLADSNCVGGGAYDPPTWSISESSTDSKIPVEKSNYVVSQRKADKLEELILDWIKLRCWNFTDSDLRWIDGCKYIGGGEFETALMQLSPKLNTEGVARRILQEVDHSEVRQSLRHITFEESSPLILVRNHILPYGELLLPNPQVSQLINAVRSCHFR
ncbi:uncharacterized protein ELE39_002622 [Cryptosporidium sp. chipmunk genotype I]|uniref:uncharacterized protein n=1 Tax=Cryptosporidium sp. chipmunk genotype I TaxID=1280935 RepID=UPI003519F6CC|nr:hypothetical protein ELE39_002622 [Cryptosporidium sp. chipmunk genotype I]